MRNLRWIPVAALVAVVLLAVDGCATWIVQQGPKPACVATYIRVAPKMDVGLDGCGNSWVRFEDTGQCFILSAAADSMIAIPCPAAGDTLAVGQ
jgi:hypothetical protein